ncbi:MAG: nucleotidyltransferase family protein [Clostridia bacterium]|nr:nucleotidyltransferase family protein [Clostridia bacterium]
MKIAGIICEYNPFHNGHALHIARTREMTGCEYIVAVMSGAFTQRGDPAIIDKWTRAKMALRCGADIVVELPAAFAIRPADKFAFGGVSILSGLGCEYMSFGCETGDIELIKRIARETANESPELSGLIRDGLARGLSHARARGEAYVKICGASADIVNLPNAVLAIEYLKVNSNLVKPMKPVLVKREGDYHGLELGDICSASAIRRGMNGGEDVRKAMPQRAFDLLDQAVFARPEGLDGIAVYVMRNACEAWLNELPESGEGAYMLLKKHAALAIGRGDLLERAKCKRYTMARLCRMLTYAMLGVKEKRLSAISAPQYARVIGFRKGATGLMRHLKDAASIPLVTDPTRLKSDECFAIEKAATDLWFLAAKDPAARIAGMDYTRQIVIED